MLLVNFKIVFAIRLSIFLVEYSQQSFETIAGSPGEKRNLYNDAVMGQALDEGIGRRKWVVIIIQIATAHINHRFGEVAQGMSQDVDRDDGQAIRPFLTKLVLLFDDVLLIEVLGA